MLGKLNRVLATFFVGACLCACGKNDPPLPPPPATAPPAAAAAAATKVVSACDLVTAAEMSAILGATVAAAAKDRAVKAECIYQATSGVSPYLDFSIDWGDAADAMRAAAVMGHIKPGMTDPLAGIGDEAIVVGTALMIRNGDDLIQLVFSGVDDRVGKAAKIVALAQSRMPRKAAAAPGAEPATGNKAADAQAAMNLAGGLLGALAGAADKASGQEPGKSAANADAAKQLMNALSGGKAELKSTPEFKSKVVTEPLGAEAAKLAHIPFIAGLTTVHAVNEKGKGDYESIGVIKSLAPESYMVNTSGEVPPDSGEGLLKISVRRRVDMRDSREARTMRNHYHTGDPELFAGTTPGISGAVLQDLRIKGRATLNFLSIGNVLGMQTERKLTGEMVRVESVPIGLSVLVNDKLAVLPVLHAKGKMSDADGAADLEFYVLDDENNPLILRLRGPGFVGEVVKINYPEPPGKASHLEQALNEKQTVEIYGIYFSFNSAVIRPESEPVLIEIAGVMARHPDWKLNIGGHTDNIGGDRFNRELSERRAAAVKAALVDDHHVGAGRFSSAGYGAGSPKEPNDTAQGRARNRRVELSRQ